MHQMPGCATQAALGNDAAMQVFMHDSSLSRLHDPEMCPVSTHLRTCSSSCSVWQAASACPAARCCAACIPSSFTMFYVPSKEESSIGTPVQYRGGLCPWLHTRIPHRPHLGK